MTDKNKSKKSASARIAELEDTVRWMVLNYGGAAGQEMLDDDGQWNAAIDVQRIKDCIRSTATHSAQDYAEKIRALEAEVADFAKLQVMGSERIRAAALAEREACLVINPPLVVNLIGYGRGWLAAIDAYRALIQARPAP